MLSVSLGVDLSTVKPTQPHHTAGTTEATLRSQLAHHVCQHGDVVDWTSSTKYHLQAVTAL